MSHELPYVVIDVFAPGPLQGNPLAVFLDAGGLDGARMQALARELNLSETVFLTGPAAGGEVPVRIFTPGTELPFAGHPALGAACVVGARTGHDRVTLRTGSGPVPVTLTRDRSGSVTGGEMEQPIPTWAAVVDPRGLLDALGLRRSQLPVERYDNGVHHLYVMLDSPEAVTRLAPDVSALARAIGGAGVSCFSLAGADRLRTRMFGPGLGVVEDPATGSAAGPLAVHLARHGVARFGTRLRIEQGAEIGRPSLLRACAEGSGERVSAVRVGGDAVPVAEGVFRLPEG